MSTEKRPILLIGGGGHCHACIDVIEATGKYLIKGIIDTPNKENSQVMGYPIIGTDEILEQALSKTPSFLITLGQAGKSDKRKKLFQRAEKLGGTPVTISSPSATIARGVKLQRGTIVMHQVLLNSNVNTGSNCIINSQALVEHDTTIGDHTVISTGAVLNGQIRIGNDVFIGTRVTIFQGLDIGDCATIGGGLTVRTKVNSSEKRLSNG